MTVARPTYLNDLESCPSMRCGAPDCRPPEEGSGPRNSPRFLLHEVADVALRPVNSAPEMVPQELAAAPGPDDFPTP